MTEPLTPPECDLQDFPFMPLHVARLRDSDLAAEEGPEACWYAVLLWAAAWHQIPAASLPDNDAVLARLIGLGRDVRTFKKHKAGALRGFVTCSDGRLYHPVVAEQAVSAWNSKLQQRWRTECARIKKHNQRTGETLAAPTFEEFLAAAPSQAVHRDAEPPVPRDTPPSPQGQGLQGTETGTGRPISVSDETVADDPTKAELDGLWALASTRSRERSSRKDLERSAKAAVRRGNSLADIRQGLEAYFAGREATKDGGEFAKGIHRLIENDRWREYASTPSAGVSWQSGEMNPSPDKQRFWMREWTARADWRRGDRGPTPGEPGCRVAPAIQREFGVEPIEERVA